MERAGHRYVRLIMAIILSRRARTLLVAATAIVVVVFLCLAAVPVGWLKEDAEKLLSRQTGRPVTIGEIGREDRLSFTPVIRVSDIDVAQASWAGEGKLATVRLLRVRINVFALLFGRAEPQLLSASGARLHLVRAADRRVNWRSGESGGEDAAVSLARLKRLDAVVNYRDDYQKRAFEVALKLDPENGFSAEGDGEVAENPVKLSARGPVPAAAGRWPFEVTLTGDAIDLDAKGTMARPFDPSVMSFRAKARANDLKLVDRIIEAGLFETQPVDLSATVERDGGKWTLSSFDGTIGRSDIAGRATIVQAGSETSLEASLRSKQLDFEDLASDAGNAAAIALERSEGLKVVPNTRINIGKVALTKGRMEVQIDRLVSARRPSAFHSLNGVLKLEGKLLTVESLNIALTKGELSGTITVDQREKQQPLVSMALDLRDSSINALFGTSGTIDAPVDARIRLAGTGDTIREAVGRSEGAIGLVAGGGSLPDRLAMLMGFDVGRALFAGDEDRASLRCAAVRLRVRDGMGVAGPLLVDTDRSQARGRGSVRFPEERMAMTFTGAPKGDIVLRVPGAIMVRGTVREPEVIVPRNVRSVGNVLKGIGRAITGRQGPKAVDADCDALRKEVLRD